MTQTANATIYGVGASIIPLDTLRAIAVDAQSVTANRDPQGTGARFIIQWPNLQIVMNVMPPREIPRHIEGFAGYVQQLAPVVPAELIRLFRGIRQVHGLVITPGWDDAGRVQRVVLGVTTYYQGVFFAAGAIYNGTNALVLGPANARPLFFITKPTATSEAEARKARSEGILQAEGVPFIAHLPVIDDESTAHIRPIEDIAKRAVALALVASRGEGLDAKRFKDLVDHFGAQSWFTPKERAAIVKKEMSARERINFTWRYEACAVLLWALGYINNLGRPDHVCNPAEIVGLIAGKSYADFLQDAKPVPASAILDQADLVYRYAWAVDEARLKGKQTPGRLDFGVVAERHYTLKWLIGYLDAEWDDVRTDT